MDDLEEESRLVRGLATLPRGLRRAEEDLTADLLYDVHSPLKEGVVENLRNLLPQISVADSQNVSHKKRVRHLNDLAKVIKHAGHVIDPYYSVEKVIEHVRLALVSSVKEVRAGALRVLRYLVQSAEVLDTMMKLRIDILVARSLDVPPDREIERLQAMRFVRQAISVAPLHVSQSLVSPMVSILSHDSEPLDNLTWSCMATLSELALVNPELASKAGAIKALLRGLLKSQASRISESVTLTLTYLLNTPSARKFIRPQLDLESLLAPITDLHYRYLVDEADKSVARSDHESRLEAAKLALVAMLKSWPGVFCLCSPNNQGISSLLSMLPLAKPPVQREILDILYSVFQLKVPEWTESHLIAVASIDPAQPKSEWSLSEGWVVEEGNDLLPPKTMGRTNLIDCYQALLLAALMEAGLFECLVEVVVQAVDRKILVMATILMGQLLHLANTILPPEMSRTTNTLPSLVASAMAFNTQEERNQASEVISCLDRVHQLKKQGVKPSSLYLKLLLEQSGYFSRLSSDSELFQHIPAGLDEAVLSGLVKDTNVLNTKDYMKWNWNLIFSLLQHPSLRNPQFLEDAIFSRFIKRMRNFYKPSNHLYSILPYSETSSHRYTAVGQQLVKYLCQVEEGSTTGNLVDLMSDIVDELSQVTASKLTADVFSSSSVAHKLARDYFLFLGTVSFHKMTVLKQCKAYGPLLDICNYNRSDLMKLTLATLDFGHDTHSRVILSKILTATDKDMRLYATRHMRVLLRAKMPFFNSWGLELLVPQLYDLDKRVAMEAVDILDEACEEENFLEALVLQQPALLHLGEKGAALFTRFISIKRGYSLMSRLGLHKLQLERWFENYNTLYVYIVEERLAEALTSYKSTEKGEYIRRANTSVLHPKAFVPVHYYGQIVQHEEGCALLESEGHVQRFSETVRQEPTDEAGILAVKAAIWALGHIGSSLGGLELLLSEEVVSDLVDMAEESPILSLRGTCFYALCLISKTQSGAAILLDEGWMTVRHSLEEKWPLVLDRQLDAEEGAFVSPVSSPIHSFPPLHGTFDVETLPSVYRSPLPKVSSYGGFSSSDDSASLIRRLRQERLGHSSSDVGQLRRGSGDREGAGGNGPDSPASHRVTRTLSRRSRKFAVSLKELSPRNPVLQRLQLDKSLGNVSGDRSPTTSRHERPKSTTDGYPHERKSPSPFSSLSSFTARSFSRSMSQGSTGVRVGHSGTFIGVCLPLEITAMFEYDQETYEASDTLAPDFSQESVLHDPTRCMECQIAIRAIPDPSTSSECLHPLSVATSSSSLSPDTRPRTHTIDSPRATRNLRRMKPRGTHSRSTSDLQSAALVSVAPQGSAMADGSSGQERRALQDQGKGREVKVEEEREAADGGERKSRKDAHDQDLSKMSVVEGRGSRSPSPLVRMKRVEIGDDDLEETVGEQDKEANGGGSGRDTETAPEVVAKSQESSETKTSSGGDTEGSATPSSASGPKGGIIINVVAASASLKKSKSPPDQTNSSAVDTTTTNTTTPTEDEAGDTASISSTATTQSMVVDEASQEGRRRLHNGVLEVVYNLTSDVSIKKNVMSLNMICHRFPTVCQDVCLYTKVMELLSSYHYNLTTRRFIQSKFESLDFSVLFATRPPPDIAEEDTISSSTSSRPDSISSWSQISGDAESACRRRSSTSDVTRFRDRLTKSLSRERHREVMAEESLPQGRGDSQNTNTNNSVGSDRGALGSDSEEECSEGPREQALEVRQLSRSQETATSVVVNVAYDL